MVKEIRNLKILIAMGFLVLGLIWVSGCKQSNSEAQSIFADTNQSQWDLNDTSSSDVLEIFLQGEGVEKIILDSIAMIGDKPGAQPLKALSADFQGKRVCVLFAKSDVANLMSVTTRGSKHMIIITFMKIEKDEKEELPTEIILGDEIPSGLTLEISPDEWDLGYFHSSGTVKAFIRGVGFEKVDVATIIMKGDNTAALPLSAISASRQGNHVRAEFPKNQVLNLLLNPTKGSIHTIIINFLEIGGTDPIELTAQITITDEDEEEEPGALALEIDPTEWDLNFVNSSGKVEAFIRGEGIEKIDLTSVQMKGDSAAAPMVPESIDLNGDHIRASFPKNQVLNLLNDLTVGSVHTITVTFLLDGVATELTATITVTDEDGEGEEPVPGELTLQVSPSDWNLNYYKNSGTVTAFIRGAGIDKIILTSIQLIGDNTAALPLNAKSATLNGDHVRATFPKNLLLDLLLNPISGSQHTVTVGFDNDSGHVELTAVITVVGKAE